MRARLNRIARALVLGIHLSTRALAGDLRQAGLPVFLEVQSPRWLKLLSAWLDA